MDDVIAGIGPKLRDLRQQKGLSLKQLAERSGVSAAAIHKIERSSMVPTIATLMRLASALNRSVGWFVAEDDLEDRQAVMIRAGYRRPVFTSKQGLTLEGISGPYGRFFMAGAIAEIEPDSTSGAAPMEHAGEELLYVLSGSLEFEVAEERFTLRRGDALHFRTDRPHSWRSAGDRPARVVWLALRQP